MAVAYDNVGPSVAGVGAASATSINWYHLCQGDNRLLIVGVGLGGGATTATTTVTYAGIQMTSAGKVNNNNVAGSYVELFYLVGPPRGSFQVIVTSPTGGDLTGGSTSFTGVDQSTPISNTVTNFGNSAAISATVTSATGNMVVDVGGAGSALSASGQTLRWNKNLNGSTGGSNSAQSTANGAASVNMSYTISATDWWGIVATNINAAAPVATTALPWLRAPIYPNILQYNASGTTNTTVTSFSVYTGTQITGGSLIIMIIYLSSGTLTPPAGFTDITGSGKNFVFARIVNAGETSPWNFTITSAIVTWQVFEIINATSLPGALPAHTTAASATTITTPSPTITTPSLILGEAWTALTSSTSGVTFSSVTAGWIYMQSATSALGGAYNDTIATAYTFAASGTPTATFTFATAATDLTGDVIVIPGAP